jgi:protein-disulfide isomerase-like protein with CxxC motif
VKQPDQFDDAEAKRIIQRAAEIDARKSMDATTLRQVAMEAGISPASVDKALEEHLQAPTPPTLLNRLKPWSGLLVLAIIIALFVIGRLMVSVPQP